MCFISQCIRLLIYAVLVQGCWLFADALVLIDKNGRSIEAEILHVTDAMVEVRRVSDQRIFEIPWRALSQESVVLIKERSNEVESDSVPVRDSSISFAELNDGLGISLFSEESILSEDVRDIAERLDLSQESEVSGQRSYRSYYQKGKNVLGAKAFTMGLSEDAKQFFTLNIVFANKGDVSAKGITSREITDATRNDERAIQEKLTSILGEPERISFGKGSTRERVDRWDWNQVSFLLAAEEGEYVTVRVVQKKLADAAGKTERVSDKEARALAEKNILRKKNGDVVLQNVPMVDQGPKGYCVPATFERYLRYLGEQADMYLIAMSGETEIGGGTSMNAVMDGMKRNVSRYGRSLKSSATDLSLSEIMRFIDRGLPVMWTMQSSKQFNEIANQQTKERTNHDTWPAKAIELQRNANSLSLDESSPHIVLIVGYNEQTGELAFSDSWGPRYKERWMLVDQAKHFSQGMFYYIDF